MPITRAMIKQLRDRREELELSDREISEASGIERAAVNKILNGKKKIVKIERLAALCKALKIDMKIIMKNRE